MEAKEAVDKAKEYIQNIFENELIEQIGLEELERNPDKKEWYITVGFSRKLDTTTNTLEKMIRPVRSYKVVRISEQTGDVISIKNHSLRDEYAAINS